MRPRQISLNSVSGSATAVVDDIKSVITGRLTLATGVPITTTDQTAKSTLYFTPYHGDKIGLYTGSVWDVYTFSELSKAISGLTTGVNYDVFAYASGTSVVIDSFVAWTDNTTRATALTTQDGVYVKDGAPTRRYLGTFRTTAPTTTEDSDLNRLVWNACNRAQRRLRVQETTDTWTYSTNTWRSANNSDANRVTMVVGLAESFLNLLVNQISYNTVGNNTHLGIGRDATDTLASGVIGVYGYDGGVSQGTTVITTLKEVVPLGFHFYQWIEKSGITAGTTTWVGDAGDSSSCQFGMIGTVSA